MWDSDVDFDLAAFHTLVRALKRLLDSKLWKKDRPGTLRQLVEGALAHVLLKDLSNAAWLSFTFQKSHPKGADPPQGLHVHISPAGAVAQHASRASSLHVAPRVRLGVISSSLNLFESS